MLYPNQYQLQVPQLKYCLNLGYNLPSFFLLGPQMNAKKNKDTKNIYVKHVCFI